MITEPIQTLDLVRGELPSLAPIVGMWAELWPGHTFALHPDTYIALMQHYAVPPNARRPAAVDLRDDVPGGHVHPLPPDPAHPFVRLAFVEP